MYAQPLTKAEQLKNAMQSVLQSKDGVLIYQFTINNVGVDIRALQTRLLMVGGAFEIHRFAVDVKGANKQLCFNRMMEIADGWEAYWFALDVPGAKALQERVMKRGCPKSAFLFARDIDGADVVRLYQFAKSGSMRGLTPEESTEFNDMIKKVEDGESHASQAKVVANLYRKAINPDVDITQIHGMYKQAEVLGFSGLSQPQFETFRGLAEKGLRQKFLESV